MTYCFQLYYDNKVARIIANEFLDTYILQRINNDKITGFSANDIASDGILWTDTQNVLIELIDALYANGSLSYGKVEIRKISLVLEKLFRIILGDLHNASHRIKYRAGSRTAFLDQLKSSLKEYMQIFYKMLKTNKKESKNNG